MFCNQCGANLAEGSRFCNRCGAGTVVATEGVRGRQNAASFHQPAAPSRPVRESAMVDKMLEDEHVIFTLRPTLLFVLIWYGIAALVVIAVAALLGILSSGPLKEVDGWVIFVSILTVGLLAFSIPLYKHVLRRREVYTLTNHKLEMRYGIIAKTVRNIPLAKIQDVTVTASVWQRLLKLGDIVIDSASETGKIVLDEVHNPEYYANIILTELRRRN